MGELADDAKVELTDEEIVGGVSEVGYSVLNQIKELVDNLPKLSIAYVNQLRINDMRTVNDELRAHSEEIAALRARMDKASEMFGILRKKVEKINKGASNEED